MSTMTTMSKRERVQAAIAGEPVDHPPASLWGHDFLREWSNEELVGATCEQYEAYDWDFIKINPRWSMFPEAWGAVYAPPSDQSNPTLISAALGELEELHDVVSVHAERGVLGEHIESTRLVLERTRGEVDVVQTVFSPMSVVGLMFGHPRAFKQAALEAPAAVHGAVARVTETIINYSRANLNAGASGVFYAPLQWASRDISTADFYREFGRPYDLQVLDAIRDAEFNILHVCHTNNMLADLLDYPVQAINWDDRHPSNASLAAVWAQTDKAVMGGVSRSGLGELSAAEVQAQASEAAAVGNSRVFVTGGCSIPPHTPSENRAAVGAGARGS